MMSDQPARTGGRLSDLRVSSRIFRALQDDDLHLAPEPDLPPIKDYMLLRRLGTGGGGEVFLAMRRGTDRPLAIKLQRHAAGDSAAQQRSWRELDILAQLHAPCVPRVHDYGLHDGRLYIVTDYVEGLPLAKHCQVSKLDRPQRVELLARLADAIQGLHERGVIHRDIKPSNVIVDMYGQPIVIDFGIAHIYGDVHGATLTQTGAPIGSPAFMAPEQARGDRQSISTRTDVYALGAVAALILTGKPPHDTDMGLVALIQRVAHQPVGDLRRLDPTLPKPLVAVLAKALAHAPEARYPSAAEFASDLRRWLSNEPVRATAVPLWTRVNLYRKRNRGAFAAMVAATFLLTLAMGSVGWALSESKLRGEAEQLAQEKETFAKQVDSHNQKLRQLARELVDTATAEYDAGLVDDAATTIYGLSYLFADGSIQDEELQESFSMTRRQVAAKILAFLYSAHSTEQVHRALDLLDSQPPDQRGHDTP